jgi:glycosyltransferase involved in cell wall biosynthesis
MNPTFSVYIPAYNRARYLGQAIESVLNQTFEDFELIIIDDCSTDNTKEVVHGYKDKRIRYYYNEKNLGCVASHNKGLTLARGRYIHPLDSDDLLFPANLEEKEHLFSRNPNTGLVYSDANIIDTNGNVLKESYWQAEGYMPVKGRLNSELIASCGCVMINPAYKKEAVAKVGLQNTKLIHPHDGEYRLRIAAEFEVDYVPKALYSWRIHPAGRHLTKNEEMYMERANVIREISEKYPWAISKTFKKICVANNLCQGGLFLRKKNDFKKARALFKAAVKECPYHPLSLLWYLNTYIRINALWNIETPKKYFLKFVRTLSR